MLRKAIIWVNDERAGELIETEEGIFIFQYEKTYCEDEKQRPVSLTLRKRLQPYTAQYLFPFFDGLIPEGWLLEIGIKNWKIDPTDRFGLLLHLCKECIGNASVVSEEHQS